MIVLSSDMQKGPSRSRRAVFLELCVVAFIVVGWAESRVCTWMCIPKSIQTTTSLRKWDPALWSVPRITKRSQLRTEHSGVRNAASPVLEVPTPFQDQLQSGTAIPARSTQLSLRLLLSCCRLHCPSPDQSPEFLLSA